MQHIQKVCSISQKQQYLYKIIWNSSILISLVGGTAAALLPELIEEQHIWVEDLFNSMKT